MLAAWIEHLRGAGTREGVREAVVAVLSELDDDLGSDQELVELVEARIEELRS